MNDEAKLVLLRSWMALFVVFSGKKKSHSLGTCCLLKILICEFQKRSCFLYKYHLNAIILIIFNLACYYVDDSFSEDEIKAVVAKPQRESKTLNDFAKMFVTISKKR